MSQDRRSGPKVFGVLSIVFASLTILSSLVGGCSLSMSRGGKMAAFSAFSAAPLGGASGVAEAYQRYYDSTFIASAAQLALLGSLSILLLFVGIGQLRYRRWAWVGTLAWGAAALAVIAVMQLLSHLVFRPAAAQLVADLMRGLPPGSPQAVMMGWMSSFMGGGATSWIMLIVYLPYPLLQLLYFGRGSIRQVMTAED